VRALLDADRAWCAFALADLTPPYAEHSEWHTDGRSLVLIYRGFAPPLLFVSGDAPALLLEHLREPEYYFSLRPEALPALRAAGYTTSHETAVVRMVLQRFVEPDLSGTVRLGPGDLDDLLRLYTGDDAPPFFSPSMLSHGVFYGIREGGELVAAAGTQVLAREEGVAAVGNVFTRRDRRNCGYSLRVTGAVVRELSGLPTIVLNVYERNGVAIRVYQRLGFVRHCAYLDGTARRPVSD
jgi:ribosomal protein S18 acetylase RimI-like enzyme